jgi:hypothetical protein
MEITVEDEKTRKQIEDIVVCVPVIDERNNPGFSNDFVNECWKIADEGIAKVYYSEYNRLIKSLGGSKIANPSQCKIMSEIFKNKEKLENFMAFGEIWDNKSEISFDTIREPLE